MAAKAGGKILKKYFGQKLKITEKSSVRDLVSRADQESEKAILKILKKSFPDFNIFGEEGGHRDNGSTHTFAVDPLDGTHNFLSGIPNFTVSIGLLRSNQIIAGVVYQPIINYLYWAEEGKGSYLGGQKLRVGRQNNIAAAAIAYAVGYNQKNGLAMDKKLMSLNWQRIFRHWSLAYDFCLLAQGKIDAVVVNGNNLYDFAAGKLIARQAGALITDFSGKKEYIDSNSFFVASNGLAIHKHLLKIIKAH